ncbi:peptidylprolyl isomerase [Aristaeella lactis]|uniref:PPIC-type PPIASE domain-containing protein n=1 Tax=Aristaeella lactis TaxID=3046383 RepID=A0AC61PKY1_9FIRM|nr:peptidylprolyl isomerase [Aristaeella lactis]QUA52089.1 peptidylprolyl isomerase [Aristaeella lactis]SMC57652.1 PPIC-type PPIASE domain-containing protein [Aristaeella lactis]
MRKKALLALMMAAVLLLSGCALIQKDQAVDDATEIIRMGDKVYTKIQVKAAAQQELINKAQTYSMFGYAYDMTDPANIAEAQEAAVKALKEDLTLTAKAAELGFDQLTDEELEAVKAKAQESYDNMVNTAKQYVEGKDEMDEAALTEAAVKMAEDAGYTMENRTESATKDAVSAKLKEYAVKDVAVTDEEIQAEYDSKVESNKETYAENAASWAATANNGYTTLYYTPAGVRRVKQILVKFTEEDQTAIKDANTKLSDANTARTAAQDKVDAAQKVLDTEGITDEEKTKAEADLTAAKQELDEADKALLAANQAVTDATDKAFANIDEKADTVVAQLAEGGDWQKLTDEYNEDTGMKDNEKGYAVAAGMSGFDAAFVDAAMALEKIGDVSPKTKGQYGYYIIRYESDEAEGPIALDTLKETISSSLLNTKQNDTYEATLAQWVEEAGIKVDMNALKD